jgi:hypothetical protein
MTDDVTDEPVDFTEEVFAPEPPNVLDVAPPYIGPSARVRMRASGEFLHRGQRLRPVVEIEDSPMVVVDGEEVRLETSDEFLFRLENTTAILYGRRVERDREDYDTRHPTTAVVQH